MLIPEQLAAWIRERIAALAVEHSDVAVARLAQTLDALPLLADMGGLYALRPTGEVVSIDWDAEEEPTLESDPRIIDIALARGSKRYPELSALLPARRPDSPLCTMCQGTGVPTQFAHHPILRDGVACWCGGLGFLPSTWGPPPKG